MDRAGRGMVSVRVASAFDLRMRRRILVALSLIAMAPLSSSSGESRQQTGDGRWRNARWLYCGGPLIAGCQYFRAGHFDQAADSFRELAQSWQGPFNMYANYNLGYLFEQGFGVEKQPALAVSHYERANGIPKAQHRLALLTAHLLSERSSRRLPPLRRRTRALGLGTTRTDHQRSSTDESTHCPRAQLSFRTPLRGSSPARARIAVPIQAFIRCESRLLPAGQLHRSVSGHQRRCRRGSDLARHATRLLPFARSLARSEVEPVPLPWERGRRRAEL
jgi:hypothetical protein